MKIRYDASLRSNASNSILKGIRIKPGLPHARAILAQEVFEYEHKRRKFIPCIISTLIKRLTGTSKFHRRMEVKGHMIEAVFAEPDAVFIDYVRKEAHDLAAYESFKGYSPARILAEMYVQEQFARNWVASNRGRILDLKIEE